MAKRSKASYRRAALKGWRTRRAKEALRASGRSVTPENVEKFLARRRASKKGWRTRRAKAATRSERSRKGWRTRRAKAKLAEQAKPAKGPQPRGRLHAWCIGRKYTKRFKGRVSTRTLEFTVLAPAIERAEALVNAAIFRGSDDLGYDLIWAQKIPWESAPAFECPEELDEIEDDDAETVQVR